MDTAHTFEFLDSCALIPLHYHLISAIFYGESMAKGMLRRAPPVIPSPWDKSLDQRRVARTYIQPA